MMGPKYLSETAKSSHQRCCMKELFLKLVSAIFYQIFIFHQMIALQKL